MSASAYIDVIIPAFDHEAVIAALIAGIPRPLVRQVLVVDNGSRDATARFAKQSGARVIHETRVGYGYACLAGMANLSADCDIVVFLPVFGCDPADITALAKPIVEDRADLVVAARTGEPRAVPPSQKLANAIASRWLRTRFDLPATDVGPLRAIRRGALDQLHMEDTQHGWNLEMQIKTAQHHLRYAEVPATYHPQHTRVRASVRGAIRDGAKMLGQLARSDRRRPRR